MKLMKFTPEVEHLRGTAKAYAAGECTRMEYRSLRRGLIANFRPRPLDDDTQRRVQNPVDSPAPIIMPVTSSCWRWQVWLCLLLVLVGVAAAGVGYAATIPPVRERDPNPAQSPRYAITTIQLGNFEPLKGLDETQANQVIQDRLAQIRSRHNPGEHGFSQIELEQVGMLLNAFGVHDSGTGIDAAQARELQELIHEQKVHRGLSVLELEEIAQAVQALYRQQGYFLAVAYVPAQATSNGIARIDVLPGTLGAVAVRGGDSDLVRAQFGDLLDRTVRRDVIEQRMFALNQLPGIQAQAVFQPGDQLGSSRLNIDLIQRNNWSAMVRLDNHGDPHAGQERLAADVSWLDLRGVGDVLQAGLLTTLSPADQRYGFLRYQTPIFPGYQLSARVSNNRFDQDGLTVVRGDSRLFDLGLARTFARQRTRSFSVELTSSWHQLVFDDYQDQSILMLGGMMKGHRIWDQPRLYADTAIGVEFGTISQGTRLGQDSLFWRIHGQSFAWLPIQLPLLPAEQKLSLDLSWQYTGSELPTTRQFNLSGAQFNRGFDRGLFRADRAITARLELRQPLGYGDSFVFFDTGYGSKANSRNESWVNVNSIGVGWDLDLTQGLTSRLTLGLPLASDGIEGGNDDSPILFWSFEYRH